MIIYFADRTMQILGMASTNLPEGLTITNDLKTEEIDTGVAIFECTIPYTEGTRQVVEECTEAGNYVLRSDNGENEFYTIIESEKDTKKQTVYIYAEDAGMDLLNEIVGAYEADQAYPISHYINEFANDSGFVIGINEAENLTRTLSWTGEATAAERIASVATQFDNCEVSYSFDIKGLKITNKYINIYQTRGKDIGVQLRLNNEIDRIIVKKSVADLATSLQVTGGIPEGEEDAITLIGYEYDDGDMYVTESGRLNSREAVKKWSRYVWEEEPNQLEGYTGHIVAQYSYDTTSQSELCNRAISKLKEICDVAVNYEIEFNQLPQNVAIGDTIQIIDEKGKLYLSSRILKLKTSRCDQTQSATIGDFLIKDSGISDEVEVLAGEFTQIASTAKQANSLAVTALNVANSAQSTATSAENTSNTAQSEANNALSVASDAQSTADNAASIASEAQSAANTAQNMATNALNTANTAQDAANNAEDTANSALSTANNVASMIYQSSDTMAVEGYYGGYIINNGTSLCFSIPCVFANDITTATADDWQVYVWADGSYEIGSANNAATIQASNIALTLRNHHIDVEITLSANANNTAAGIEISSGNIAFS